MKNREKHHDGPKLCVTTSQFSVAMPLAVSWAMAKGKAEGVLKVMKLKRRSQRELQDRPLNLLLQSVSPSLRRPVQRRKEKVPTARRQSLMLARSKATWQSMGKPIQTRHRNPNTLQGSRESVGVIETCFW